jgi:hypothetical protein
MLSSTLLSVGAFAMGLVQGYLCIPTFFGATWLGRWAVSCRPGMDRHRLSRILTSVMMALGLVLAHGALAIAWLGRLARLSTPRELDLGKYWGVALFAGMLLFSFMPKRRGDAAGASGDDEGNEREGGAG